MERPRTIQNIAISCMTFALFLGCMTAYGQTDVLDNDAANVISHASGASLLGHQTKILLALKTDSVSTLWQIAGSESSPYGRILSDGHSESGSVQTANSKGTQSNPGRKVRKVPLILGIAGAVVMAAGIAMAADPCGGYAPCFRTQGAIAAGVGGAVAVTGFYFAFRR